MDKRRKLVQIAATLLYNPYFKGFIDGHIYDGPVKGVCVPGLNCYSCPAAAGSCPLGALQNTLGTLKRGINTYVIGSLLLFSALFGRLVCGWMCPFGLLQELLYRIPSPKIRRPLRGLRFLKYVFLIVFVIALPVGVMAVRGIGYPAFCKYICPQGTVGGLALVAGSDSLQQMIRANFYFKLALLILCALAAVLLFRPFCRFVCPLGAIYGLFNSVALIRLDVDKMRCTRCGQCARQCPVHLNPATECNKSDCVRCGKCVSSCSEGAIRFRAGFAAKQYSAQSPS